MYLIGIKNNTNPCGNEGTLITHYKMNSKITEVANNFKKMYNHDEVYSSDIYTQKMCEMTGKDFVEYVRIHCKRIL